MLEGVITIDDDITEEQFIEVAMNPDKIIRKKFPTKDSTKLFVIVDREFIFEIRKDLYKKYRLLVEEEQVERERGSAF